LEYKKNTEELEKDKDWFYERFANNYTAEIYKENTKMFTGFKMVDFIDFIL